MQWHMETEFQVVKQGEDREVTIGPLMLTILGIALLALCCICFVTGYAVGHRSASVNPTGTTASAHSGRPAAEILAQSQAAYSPASGAPTSASHAEPSAPAIGLSPVAAAQTPESPSQPEPGTQSQPVQQPPAAQSGVRSALPQSAMQQGSFVVQVAAVENSQDADVLVSALRHRGYSVTAHRDPGDNLLHVQVGPFASRSDADAMRQKLLNDGYNAIVEQ